MTITDTKESAKSAPGEVPRDLVGFLDFYLVQKAPLQIPEGAKQWIVQYGPWIALVLMVFSLPALLVVLGLGTALMPFGGTGYPGSFTFLTIGIVVQLGLMGMAMPGLFARKMSGWRLMFYAQLVSIAMSLLRGSIVGAVVGGAISLYVLFQVRALYKA